MLVLGAGGVLAVARPRGNPTEAEGAPLPGDRRDWDLIMDGIDAPLLIVAGNRVEAHNRAARDLIGTEALSGDIRLALRNPAVAELLDSPTTEAAEAELEDFGGRDRMWTMCVSPETGGRRVVHLVDRTAAKAAERMRVDFVANASHELRTPLAAILGYVETLADEDVGGETETRTRFLGVIGAQARRMTGLIEDLLSISRIDADRHRPTRDLVDLAALAAEAAEILAAERGEERRVAIDTGDDVPQVPGDRVQLAQLVHNLIENALRYGRAGTPVKVAVARAPRNMVAFSVTDEGEGIAQEHIPRLTERFYRVDPGRSRSLGGTGLGLAIVKHVAERHGGRIDIASTPNIGTTVTVLLPAAPGALSSKSHARVT